MNKTEKLTVNVGVVDLGYIDLLVSNGYYSNRTDFIKNSIRHAISSHQDNINDLITKKKSESSLNIVISVINKEEIESRKNNLESVDLVVVGLLIISKDIDTNELFDVYNSIIVFGSVRCDSKIKSHYNL